MRVLWSLPKAAPALLRHLGAYVELAALDLASLIILVCSLFALLMGCAAVIAVTWDTPHRLAAIAWMGGGFVALALIAMVYRSKAAAEEPPFLDSVRREWKEDSVILERILADDDT